LLHALKDMEGFAIDAIDGHIGKVVDFYIDASAWAIRYLVVALGSSHPHRDVLISPVAVNEADWQGKMFPVALTQAQVNGSPDIDTHKPVSRQQEMGYLGYYGYGAYWGGGGLWGAGLYPDLLQGGRQEKIEGSTDMRAHSDPHLRSGNALLRYYVQATDGDIGHVQGMMVDERSWAIRWLIVNTSNWWLGHAVLLAPTSITYVSWAESTISLGLTRQDVKTSPHYDPALPLEPDREGEFHRHDERRPAH
jgi:hypothetical protein